MGDIVGYLAKGALEEAAITGFSRPGQAIGADDVLRHHHGGGAGDGEDSQRQQRFDQSETAHFRYRGGTSPGAQGWPAARGSLLPPDLHVQRPAAAATRFPLLPADKPARPGGLHGGFRPAEGRPAFLQPQLHHWLVIRQPAGEDFLLPELARFAAGWTASHRQAGGAKITSATITSISVIPASRFMAAPRRQRLAVALGVDVDAVAASIRS